MNVFVDVQHALSEDEDEDCTGRYLPSNDAISRWVSHALTRRTEPSELTVRLVEADEIVDLNSRYRQRASATNVLSFPFDQSEGLDIPLLGDIVICASVVNREAEEQGKSAESHWAHMVIHGVLHLLGYDHETDHEALEMEQLERELLAGLGYADPYDEIRSGGARLSHEQ